MTALPTHLPGDGVYPDIGAAAAAGELTRVLGALATVTLVVAVGALVTCAIGWAIGAATGSWRLTTRSRTGLLVAVGAGALAGAAVAWTRFLLTTGAGL
ncbi:MAG TPA: DUF6112 family protein [Friedmanniella sp.]